MLYQPACLNLSKANFMADILSSLRRRRFYFCFPLLPHPSRSGSVSQASILEFRGRPRPERCPSGGISAPFARIPVCVQSGHAFIHSTWGGLWRHSKPVMDRFCRGSILHAFSEGLIRRTFHEGLWHYCAYILFAIHLLLKVGAFLLISFCKNVLDLAWGRSRVCSRTRRLRIYERDSNPDMIMAARDNTRKNRSSNRFIRRLVRPEVTFHLQLEVWSLKGEFTKTSPNPQL